MAGLMPAYILREWNNDGKLLAGGKIWFYQSGTLTPKAVYADSTLSTALPNPVILDAGAAADIWLGDGAYRVLITDLNDVQVRSPIDGIQGVGGGAIDASSNAALAILKTYGDLRALTTVPDVVYITGRLAEGDGGAGLFQLEPTGTDTDDDGVILVATAGAHVYRRVFDAAIDPRWYGVTYGTATSQSTTLLSALGGSARHNAPVDSKGTIYLAEDVVVPVGAVAHFSEDSFLHAGAPVNIEFQTGTKLSGDGVIFGNNVTPILGSAVAANLLLSWFGGTSPDDRWTKLRGSTSATYSAIVDISTTVNANPAMPDNFALDFSGGAKITLDGAIDISLGHVAYTGKRQIIAWTDPVQISGVAIGAPAIYPEWFGAIGAGDDSHPVYAAAKTGRVDLGDRVYTLGPIWSTRTTPTPLEVRGGTLALDATATLGTGSLALDSTTVAKASGSWFAGSALVAVNSEIPPTYTAAIKSVTGCKITGSDLFPRFAGKPRLDNGHLDLLSAHLLRTNVDGKITDAGQDLTLNSLIVAKLVLTSLASAPTLRIFSGSTVLTNPMPMFLAVITASYSVSEIFLPIPVKANNDPNVIFVFRRGIWDGQEYKLKSQYGNFYKTGTPTSEVFKDYIIAYYDYDEPGWVTFGSN